MGRSEWQEKIGQAEDWAAVKEDLDMQTGDYLLQLEECKPKTAATGRAMIGTKWLVLEGDFEGEAVFENLFPDVIPFGARQTKKFVTGCGFTVPEDPEDLEALCAEIEAKAPQVKARVTVKESDDGYPNSRVRIIQLLDEGERMKAPKASKKSDKGKKAVTVEVSVGVTVSFKDDQGDEHEGEVKKIKGKLAFVQEGDDPEPWEVPIKALTVQEAEEEPEEPEEPEGDEEDELSSMDRSELKKHIKKNEINVTVYKSTSDDDIRKAIRETTPEEEPEEAEEPEGEGEGDDEGTIELEDLVALAQAHDVELEDPEDAESVVKELRKADFDKSELSKQEIALLKDIEYKFERKAKRPKGKRKKGKKVK